MFAFVDPKEWWIEISPAARAGSWQQSQRFATAASRWNAYLNQICLDLLLPWFQEDTPNARSWMASHASIWDVVNGTAIALGSQRVVLIPTEAIDGSELEVPQEWVDIPNWTADYYLAVQVQIDESSEQHWLRVWGYATHHDLKTQGRYDAGDRTYSLDAQDLTPDLNTLGVTLQLNLHEQTRADIPPLAELSATQAENLLQRLGNADIQFPRLAVPFAMWGALLEREEWRQRLYQLRTGSPAPALTQLNQWFQRQAIAGWQLLETWLDSAPGNVAFAYRSVSRDAPTAQIKPLQLAQLTVMLLVELDAETDGRVAIMIQLHPAPGSAVLPPGIVLSLLSETGSVLQQVQARDVSQDDSTTGDVYIQLRRFRCPSGTQFGVRVELGEIQATESFIV